MNVKRAFTPFGLVMLGILFSSSGLPQYISVLQPVSQFAPLLMLGGAAWYFFVKTKG